MEAYGTEQRASNRNGSQNGSRASQSEGRDEIYLQMGRKLEDLPLPDSLGDSTHARVRRRPTGAELWCLGRVSETGGSGLVERAKLTATDLRQWEAWVSMTRFTTSQYRRRRTRPRTRAPTPTRYRTHSTDMEQGGRWVRRTARRPRWRQGSPVKRSVDALIRKNDESPCLRYRGRMAPDADPLTALLDTGDLTLARPMRAGLVIVQYARG